MTTEVEKLVKALEFYRDGFEYHPKHSRTGLNLSEWRPKQALLDDCGNLALEALRAAESNGPTIRYDGTGEDAIRKMADAESFALSTPPAAPVTVPEGWQLVPKDPMPEMLGAWYRYKSGHHWPDEPPPRDTSDYGAYRAMLSAAPEPVTVALSADEVKLLIPLLKAKISEDQSKHFNGKLWGHEIVNMNAMQRLVARLSASPSPVGESRDGLIERLVKALRPFETDWADENGWSDNALQRDRIVDWFGPSDFREVCAAPEQRLHLRKMIS